MNKEIEFRDLSTSLKVLVVFGWVGVVINIIAFIFGFLSALV